MTNKIRNFEDDLNASNSTILRQEWTKTLQKIYDSSITIIWKDDPTSQLDFGSDLLIILKNGRKYSIDVKTRNNTYYLKQLWLLEIAHQIYSNKEKSKHIKKIPGWLYKSTSDIIFIGTINENKNRILETIGFSLIPFKNEEFSKNLNSLNQAWAETMFSNNQYQLTLKVMCSFDFLKKHANNFYYNVFGDENENENKRLEGTPIEHNLWRFTKK